MSCDYTYAFLMGISSATILVFMLTMKEMFQNSEIY